jgi:hypothetical protein
VPRECRASGELFDTKMPHKPQHPDSNILLHDRMYPGVGDRKMDSSNKSELPCTNGRRKSPSGTQAPLPSSTSSDGSDVQYNQSPNTTGALRNPTSATRLLNETNSSEMITSCLYRAPPAAPTGLRRTGVPALVPSHQELSSVNDARLFQLEAYKRVLLDQLVRSTGLAHTSRQSLSAFSSVPSSSAKAFGGSGVLDGSMTSASLRVGPGETELTAPRSPSVEASVTNGFIEGSRCLMSPPAIGTDIRNKELPGRYGKKRKRGSEAAEKKTDLVGSSILDEGAVRRRFLMSHLESSVMPTPQVTREVQPTSTQAEEDHRSAAVLYLLSQEELLRERERLMSRGLAFCTSNSSLYDTGAYRSHLAQIGSATPSIPALVPPSILYSIPTATLAQHLSLTSPAFAQLNATSFTSPSHSAMMNSHHLLALARLGQTSRRDTRIFGDGISSKGPERSPYFSVGSVISNPVLNDTLQEAPLSDAQDKDKTQKADHAMHGRCFPLHSDQDQHNISPYQYFIRRQIEVFEATAKEAGTNAQGRNRPILPGQVGIRCRHCGRLEPNQRGTGAVYFPNRLDGVYQTGELVIIRW